MSLSPVSSEEESSISSPSISPQPNSPVHYLNSQLKNHTKREYFGQSFSVVSMDDQEFLIGVQIAQYLKRETFNLYRSMKIKNLEIVRATPEQVDYLIQSCSIKRGTHSVTMVPLKQGLGFISDEVKRLAKLGAKNSKKHKKRTVINTPSPTPLSQNIRNALILEALHNSSFMDVNLYRAPAYPLAISMPLPAYPQIVEDEEIRRLKSALLHFRPPVLHNM